jgi:hypothetical protein
MRAAGARVVRMVFDEMALMKGSAAKARTTEEGGRKYLHAQVIPITTLA